VLDARVPDGVRVYAVGDIHGRHDLLESIHRRILRDAAAAAAGTRHVVVYLGDYIDRGLHSREVIELLAERPLPGFQSVHLKGNHDQQLLDFLVNPVLGAAWLRYGGDATVYSYGARIADDMPRETRLQALRDQLAEVIPPRHLEFFRSLELAYEIGDYLFVHAGVHPDKPMDYQTMEDLLWIRDEFLEADCNFGKIVVHGHSITEKPEVRDNRIGIDTGAFFSNTLTCLVLEGTTRRFLSSRGD
jgi:serine/threonine protein phosphatase 1